MKSKYSTILTPEFLKENYINKQLSTYQIAKMIGCSNVIIFHYLEKFNISTRSLYDRSKHLWEILTEKFLKQKYSVEHLSAL